jgi:ABC-type phosphate transport system ATPase subunit
MLSTPTTVRGTSSAVPTGPQAHGTDDGSELQAIVKKRLRSVHMWDELRDRLNDNALRLTRRAAAAPLHRADARGRT